MNISADTGTYAVFTTNGGDGFLFMQGGTKDRSDDSIIGLSGLDDKTVDPETNSAASIYLQWCS